MLESKIQYKIIKKLEKEGWFVLKLIKTNKSGIPDLLAVKGDCCQFIEVKRPEGKLSELQKVRIKELREKNINVRIWTNYECDFEY